MRIHLCIYLLLQSTHAFVVQRHGELAVPLTRLDVSAEPLFGT
jgi:hypothetical protein